MKRVDIERRLRDASDSFTPNVLNQIMTKAKQPINDDYEIKKEIPNKRCFSTRKLIATFAAVLMLVAALGVFAGVMNQDYETIYLEINPSMEIVVNRLNRVKEVNFLNEDAEQLFEGYNLKWKNVDSVAEEFVDLSYEKGYLNEENDNIYVYVNDLRNQKNADKTAQRLKQKIKEKAIQKNHSPKIEAEKVTGEQSRNAKEERISVAKMVLIEKILKVGNSYSFEELKTKDMKELRDILKKETNNDNRNNGNNPNNENNANNDNSQDNGNSQNNSNSQNNGNNGNGNPLR